MGRQRRNPWDILLFFLVIVTVAYLCKRGWDGFYDASTGVWVSTRFIQLSHGQHWWAWDVPIPTADGVYNCVADAGDGRKIMWTCTVSGGQYTVSGLSKQGNVCEVRLHFSATITQGASPSTSSAYFFPTYPSRHRPAYFGIDFFYCSPGGANYVLTVTQVYTPANAPLEYLKNLFRQAGCDPSNLTEADLTVKFWRTLPSMDAIKNDIRGYANAYSTGSGSQAQKDFCQPNQRVSVQVRENTVARSMASTIRSYEAPAPPPTYPQSLGVSSVSMGPTRTLCAPLTSLPTPSIKHNVNLPHYCQRIIDDI